MPYIAEGVHVINTCAGTCTCTCMFLGTNEYTCIIHAVRKVQVGSVHAVGTYMFLRGGGLMSIHIHVKDIVIA